MNAILRHFHRPARRGFTMIESLIAMAISGMAIAGAFSVFIMAQRITYENDHINRVDNEARLFSDTVSKDIRQAAGLLAVYGIYNVTDGHLILKVPAIDAGEFILDYVDPAYTGDIVTFDYVVYYPNQYGDLSVIVREVFPDPASARERSTRVFGNIVKLNSFFGNFATVEDALGAFVLRYNFLDTLQFQAKEYRQPVTGSVRLRNKR